MIHPRALEVPQMNPLSSLKFRRRTEKTRQAPYIPVTALLCTERPARQKMSEAFHCRNLTAVALTGGTGVRSEELRELNWQDLVVFAVDPLASRPLGRIEDVLLGSISLDDRRHALIIEIKDPKNAHERFVAVVAEYREMVIRYARQFIWNRVETASSQRADARERLRAHFGPRFSALESATYELRFSAATFTRAALERDHDLWASALEMAGAARLRWPNGTNETVDEPVAEELLGYLVSFADSCRYSRAKRILRQVEAGRSPDPADAAWLRAQPVLVGPLMPSRKGGAIGEDQLGYIFRQYGWHAQGYLPQALRSNWQRFHKKYAVLTLEGGAKALGHANTGLTGRSYDAEDVFDLVRIARVTASALRRFGGVV